MHYSGTNTQMSQYQNLQMKDSLQQISETREKMRRIGTGQKMLESNKLLPRSSGERGRAFIHLKQ